MALDTEHFIKIPGTKTTISPTQDYNGFDYDSTHFKLAKNGLYMPVSFEFFTHRDNVIKAYNGKAELLYATGEKVPEKRVKEIYNILMSDCWVWLNGRFVEGSGFNNLDLETVVGVEDKKLITEKEPLKKCINKGGYVNLRFNKQGYPIQKSRVQKFVRTKNFWYSRPVKGSVARFLASSDWAILSCYWDPQSSYEALGVFPCARDTQKISKSFTLNEIGEELNQNI